MQLVLRVLSKARSDDVVNWLLIVTSGRQEGSGRAEQQRWWSGRLHAVHGLQEIAAVLRLLQLSTPDATSPAVHSVRLSRYDELGCGWEPVGGAATASRRWLSAVYAEHRRQTTSRCWQPHTFTEVAYCAQLIVAFVCSRLPMYCVDQTTVTLAFFR